MGARRHRTHPHESRAGPRSVLGAKRGESRQSPSIDCYRRGRFRQPVLMTRTRIEWRRKVTRHFIQRGWFIDRGWPTAEIYRTDEFFNTMQASPIGSLRLGLVAEHALELLDVVQAGSHS